MPVSITAESLYRQIACSLAVSCLIFASCQSTGTGDLGLPGPVPPHPSDLGQSNPSQGSPTQPQPTQQVQDYQRSATTTRAQSVEPVAYEASLSDSSSRPPAYVAGGHGYKGKSFGHCEGCANGSHSHGSHNHGGDQGYAYPEGGGVSHMGTPVPGYAPHPGLPLEAYTGRPGDGYTVPGTPPYWLNEQPMPENWSPQALARPWPRDEYVFDGGDREVEVSVLPDFSVRGLNLADTVAHYDTLDGEVVVEPSNRVPIYAPRFAAVRKIYDLGGYQNTDRIAGTEQPLRLVQQVDRTPATTVIQPEQPVGEIGLGAVVTFKDRNRGVGTDNVEGLTAFEGDLAAIQNYDFLAPGAAQDYQKALIADAIDAAYAWSSDQAVQVLIDNEPVIVETGVTTSGTVKRYDHEGRPLLRILKMANKKEAKPGDIIEFTLRFENMGNEPIGNVTVLDNLTARLEYVEGSAQCSLEHAFFAQNNEVESAVLRFEITNPMRVGDHGLIRFKCRVR